MEGKAFFIDTTLCTGCRGCQIACKQWNQLPATKTENWGSHQNPKDLSFYTYKLQEMMANLSGIFSRISAGIVLIHLVRRYRRTRMRLLLISLQVRFFTQIN
jgi:MinD superfamily P-loop ATPase